MICNTTHLVQVMTLTWGKILDLTFKGHSIYLSVRLDESNTMVLKPTMYINSKTLFLAVGHKMVLKKNKIVF